MAEPQETQQEKEVRWAAQRAAHETQQQGYRTARASDQGKKLVGGGSYRDHRGRDCCGHAAVKSGGWDGRGGHTEERGGQARLCVLSPFGVLSLHAFSFHSFLNNRGDNAY